MNNVCCLKPFSRKITLRISNIRLAKSYKKAFKAYSRHDKTSKIENKTIYNLKTNCI